MKTDIFNRVRTWLIGTFVLITSIAVIVPLNPFMPSKGLDQSWAFTINEAIAKGWVFGKDIIFTFGPFASICTKAYHPASDHLMLWGSLFLSLCYGGLLFVLIEKWWWALIYAGFITGFVYEADPLLYSYPLILGLVAYCRPPAKLFPIFYLPLGLLPLIKGSFLPVCAVAAVFCFVLFWLAKRKDLALTAFIVPSISLPMFWMIAGQPISALSSYFINMGFIISGYTEAMAFYGSKYEILLYIISSISIISVCSLNKRYSVLNRVCLSLFYLFFLFIVFKAGFIRHDEHAYTSAASLVIFALLLMNLNVKKSIAVISIILSIITWSLVCKNCTTRKPMSDVYQRIVNSYMDIVDGLKVRLSSDNTLPNSFQKRMDEIQQQLAIPLLIGTSDIYSFQQADLLSSKNACSLRPVFQSYSAYTPELAKLNENFLRSDKAPDHILFRIETIDRRLPSLDDGLCWPILLHDYSLDQFTNRIAYLKKKNTHLFSEHHIHQSNHRLGESVNLPETHAPLYAEIHFTQTIVGKIRSILFKPKLLWITFTLSDGSQTDYRIISNMTRSRFLISPLIEDTQDFVELANSNLNQNKCVKSILIKGESSDWNEDYTLKLIDIHYEN